MTHRFLFVVLGACALSMIAFQDIRSEQVSVDRKSSCMVCHTDVQKMNALGFPQLTVTAQEAQQQTRMQAGCTDCHAGNPDAVTKEVAHAGLHRLLIVQSKKLETTTRDALPAFRPEKLDPVGKNPMVALLPKIEKDGKIIKDPTVQTIVYHDKNPSTLLSDRKIQETTCGSCHGKEVGEFQKTAMGGDLKQRAYKTWIDKDRGPHNCGPWFIDNWQDIARNTTVAFTQEMAKINQKACNICHTGCMDCHYTPKKKDPLNPGMGQHTFSKKVTPQTCYGGGRASICHAGPEDRRRGGGYIGGAFSNPVGAEPDIHHTKGIACTDCHDTPAADKTLLHGQVKRQVNCAKCHALTVESVARSVHTNVSCEACHVQNVGAYTATFWGPGKQAGVQTPFFKYKEYYGVMKEPILIKTPKGKWIPVKPYPMAVLNQKSSGDLKSGLAWRFPPHLPDLERTDDAYAFVGLLRGLPTNNSVLAWIQMDKVSHKYGKARSCESCHTQDGEQRQFLTWKYADRGAEPFEGSQSVVANSSGLFIRDMRAKTEIRTKDSAKIEDFAPWYYLKDQWQVAGNFAVPPVKNQKRYQEESDRSSGARKNQKNYH